MFYSLKEGFAGLYRARFSSLAAISIISLSLILIGIFLIFAQNLAKVVDFIQERIELEVFIDNSFAAEQIEQLHRQISNINGIKTIKYISKEEAAEFFKQQFDSHVLEIFDENPLPASFQISLARDYRTFLKANQVVGELRKVSGVDDVVFRQDILVLMEKYLRTSIIIMITIGGFLALGSILLISNTIKLVILSRIQIIETMKLVGATRNFIRRPFIIEGLIQGIFGSFLAVSFLYIFLKIINIEVTELIIINHNIFLSIFAIGIFLGLLGSIFAIQRFLKY